MVFSSLTFLFAFFPLFLLLYFLVGKIWGIRGKNIVLFVFSLIFYAYGEPVYILLMFYSILLNFICGRTIEAGAKEGDDRKKKIFLGISLVGNLGLLIVFKYSGLLISTLNSLLKTEMTVPNISLPIGISFYSFQTMSYCIDVYQGKVRAQKDFINFGAYVAMFPQLIAGPIVRYEDIENELEHRTENTEDFAKGIRRFIAGLAKKTLIANTMAQTADALFALSASSLGTIGSWTGILAYTLQIYFDFSGYSDMAIGMGRMIGFSYPENFNFPYVADSVTDFWRRWHISLSSFFRDYVYIPLGGNRVSKPRWIFNIFAVWFLTGLWHGASWNFVLWGLYYGVLLVLEKLFIGRYLKKTKVLKHIWSLLFIVYGWVLFSQESLLKIREYTKALFGSYGTFGTGTVNAITILQQCDVNTTFIVVFLIGAIISSPIGAKVKKWEGQIADITLIFLLLLSIVKLMQGAYNPFIYFRF